MAFSDKHQCIHCEVTSCQHHDAGDLCQLDAINVKPRCDCHSGKCDESAGRFPFGGKTRRRFDR